MRNDVALGDQVHAMLIAKDIETPMVYYGHDTPPKDIGNSFANIMMTLGLDITDDSLKDTPHRVRKMYLEEIFKGLDYKNFPACTAVENRMRYDEMIACRCSVMSMCEHHFVPFMGHAYVAYIPEHKILGLSKFNRIVEFFSQRPQIQERLTAQIASTLEMILETEDVAVVIRCEHLCVKMRGVRDQLSDTVTSEMNGKFRDVPELRAEFLALARNGSTK